MHNFHHLKELKLYQGFMKLSLHLNKNLFQNLILHKNSHFQFYLKITQNNFNGA